MACVTFLMLVIFSNWLCCPWGCWRTDRMVRFVRMPGRYERVEGMSRAALYKNSTESVPPDIRIRLIKYGRSTLVDVESVRRYVEALLDNIGNQTNTKPRGG